MIKMAKQVTKMRNPHPSTMLFSSDSWVYLVQKKNSHQKQKLRNKNLQINDFKTKKSYYVCVLQRDGHPSLCVFLVFNLLDSSFQLFELDWK